MKQNARRLGAVVHNVAEAPAVINGSCGISLSPHAGRGEKRKLRHPYCLSGAGYAVTSPGFRRALLVPPEKIEGTERRAAHPYSIHALRLMRLRAAAPMLLTDAPGGILTFPSFHATVAILTPLTLRRYRGLFVALLIFDAAMLCGTVTEGAHYASDVLAGIGVAFCAYSLARRIIRVEDRSLHHYATVHQLTRIRLRVWHRAPSHMTAVVIRA
jgi:hypothetical protein